MRSYHISANNNHSCGCSSVSPSMHNAESAQGIRSGHQMNCPENVWNDSEHVLAMAYVPWQRFSSVYEPDRALSAGTIFPELDKPFLAAKGGRCR